MTNPATPSRPDTIQRYLDERYLEETLFTRAEIVSQWQKALDGVKDAHLPDISPRGQVKMAFDAQMDMARALLWVRGMRTVQSDKSHHFRLIDSVRVFAREDGYAELQRTLENLDRLRQVRTQAAYEDEVPSAEDAAFMMRNLTALQPLAHQALTAWIEQLPTQPPPPSAGPSAAGTRPRGGRSR